MRTMLTWICLAAGCSGSPFPVPPAPLVPCDGSYIPEPVDFDIVAEMFSDVWSAPPSYPEDAHFLAFDPWLEPPTDPIAALPEHLRGDWPPPQAEFGADWWESGDASTRKDFEDGELVRTSFERFDRHGQRTAAILFDNDGAPLRASWEVRSGYGSTQVKYSTGSPEWERYRSIQDERGNQVYVERTFRDGAFDAYPDFDGTPHPRDDIALSLFDEWGHGTLEVNDPFTKAFVRADEPQLAGDRGWWPQVAVGSPWNGGEHWVGAVLEGGQTRLALLDEIYEVQAYRAEIHCPSLRGTRIHDDWLRVDRGLDGTLLSTHRVWMEDGQVQVSKDTDGDGIADLRTRREPLADGSGWSETTSTSDESSRQESRYTHDKRGRPLTRQTTLNGVLESETIWTHPD